MPGESDGQPNRRLGRKLAFAAVATLGAAAAFANAAVNITHTRAPHLALAIDPDDPVALVRHAELARMEAQSGARLLEVAQRSVARLPLNGPALRLYALGGATNADLEAMRAQMRVSDLMERRDLGAQLWLIENAVEENDVNRALRHYDRALRVDEASRALLYPALTNAMDSALIRKRFAPYLRSNPPWLESFLRYGVSTTRNPVALARLARENGGWPQGTAFSSLDTELLARLTANGDFAEAAEHFRGIKGTDPSILTRLRLTNASTDWRLAPISWQPFQTEGIETFVLAGPQGGDAVEIEAQVEAGFKGVLARKFLALDPGRYRVSARLRAEDHTRQDAVRWSMECPRKDAGGRAADEVTLMRETLGLSEAMELDAAFEVPQGCPVQHLRIAIETLVTTRYVSLVLESAEVEPMAQAAPPMAVQTGL
ncbi:MAG: hypothetical protein AAF692_02525 [Pseudomonadota bacterium]